MDNKNIMMKKMLDISNFTTSYKILWFYAVYKEIINKKKNAPIKKLAATMVSISYHPILCHNLNFGKQDKLKDIVLYLHSELGIDKDESEDYICGYIMGSKDEKLNEMITKLVKYVPYRLIRPFYDDFIKEKEEKIGKKISDAQINNYIYELNNSEYDIDSLYKINKESKKIQFSESWMEYIICKKDEVKDLIDKTLISYLQNKNPDTYQIKLKIYSNKEKAY
ncbi:hypothetical protein [Intestinibacter bartlettii]|uniref:Uncharacterized protein n=1 Tax=Intestinibacter bartlettii TaxID=261299 RepID=A0ABS6DV18_9FIRM|nr:hypothetical protein [Intestinibacter bartlettii]MBU5335683.1 hypothetical protein [Intestinibacter bartlettii]